MGVLMETEQYQQVKQSVKKLLDIDLNHYKDEQMQRRLDSWLVRSGELDWKVYFQRLNKDSKELSRFRDYLTINVSAFFRDPERWQSLRVEILPQLLKTIPASRPLGSGLRIWSAGCSIGAEPYSLAMLLDELSARRHCLLATDLDRGTLQKARARGPFTSEEIRNLSLAQRLAYLEAGGPPFYVKSSLAKRIEFAEHNLLADPFPTDLDIIFCRNVVIYFTAKTKDWLYQKFQAALRPGGVLFLGSTEMILRPHEIGLKSYEISFYQKVSAK